jgi:tetratricopeptide (TPR) repeat protein
MRRTAISVFVLLLTLLALFVSAPSWAQDERLARAQSLLDEGRPAAAIEALGPLLRNNDPRALLLRSTAHFMEGRIPEGRADLDRVLELAPDLRQAWLNRAGLEISEGDYDAALASLERARALDPSAPDSHLNIGAVLLLQGHLAEATASFDRYLGAIRASGEAGEIGEAHYLVATNYAGRGYVGPAVENLRRAIAVDERFRLRARTDGNFDGIAEAPALRELMRTDAYAPAAGDHTARRVFPVPYRGGQGTLLSAVQEAMRSAGEPFDPRVEALPEWALIHGELRVKLHDQPGEDGPEGVMILSAPAGRMSLPEWERRVERLLEALEVILLRRQRAPDETPNPG